MGHQWIDREKAAHGLLENPAEYVGLLRRNSDDVILRLWTCPALGHHHSWTVFKEDHRFYVRRITWDRQKASHADLPEPITYGSEVLIPKHIVEDLFSKMHALRIPFFHLNNTISIDGVTQGIEYGNRNCAIRLQWHNNPPDGWNDLSEWLSYATDAFDNLLPVSTTEYLERL